jgi:cell division cycle 20-like protein 1 (cofactor of APC complex)
LALCITTHLSLLLLLQVTKLCDLAPGDSVCSVSWSQRGTYLSVGTNTGEVQIWDVSKLKRTRTMTGHRQRVGTQVRARAG